MRIKYHESVLFPIANKHAATKPIKQLKKDNSNICIKNTKNT